MRINTQRGIAPLIVLLIVAGIAVGGGTVVVKKNAVKKAEKAAMEAQLNASSTISVDTNSSNDKTIHVTLNEQNSSGQSGKVTITEVNGKAKVILNITGKPSNIAQPAHIHLNSCSNIGGVKFALTSVTNGASQTTLDVSIADLLVGLPLSINVHKSAAESSVYVACGDILAANLKASSSTKVIVPKVATTSVKTKVDVNANVDVNVQ